MAHSSAFEVERQHLTYGTEDEAVIRTIVLGVALAEGVRKPEHLYMKTAQLIDDVEEACLAQR